MLTGNTPSVEQNIIITMVRTCMVHTWLYVYTDRYSIVSTHGCTYIPIAIQTFCIVSSQTQSTQSLSGIQLKGCHYHLKSLPTVLYKQKSVDC